MPTKLAKHFTDINAMSGDKVSAPEEQHQVEEGEEFLVPARSEMTIWDSHSKSWRKYYFHAETKVVGPLRFGSLEDSDGYVGDADASLVFVWASVMVVFFGGSSVYQSGTPGLTSFLLIAVSGAAVIAACVGVVVLIEKLRVRRNLKGVTKHYRIYC